ncbi:MAG: alanine/glycine:cation symporter family protein [Bacteroidetes bacterium]|nr:alanine/glycine:cation symporter family protein [Bacteroidota bacterium]MDA1335250.1 alanine/glycine:cation symporter family protein [Bacteroidota bacterium]
MLKILSTTLMGLVFILSMLNPTNLWSQEDQSPANDTTMLEETIPLSDSVESVQTEVETTINSIETEQPEPEEEAAKPEGGIDSLINVYMDPVTAAVSKVIFFQVAIIPSHSIYKVDESTYVSADLQSEHAAESVKLDDRYINEDGSLNQAAIKAMDSPYKDAAFISNEAGEFVLGKPLKIPFVLIWLLLGAIFFTFYFKFINIRGFKHALDVVRGKFDNPNHAGEVSHFQALTAALSGTVGVGNIAGVAFAVSLGGPGATFWMIVAGLLGMSSKFVECTLGTKYRKQNPDGSVSGGPMYYLRDGLAKRGMKGLGKVLAILFAIACVGGSFGGGNMVQINQATKQLIEVTGGESSFLFGQSWMFGAVMALLVGLIIIGGIKSIARVTDKVVPFMVGIYVLGALVVLGGHFTEIPQAFSTIVSSAFSADAAYGGLIGVLIVGFQRAAFSNEAGIGSASIAHAAAKTDEPVSEGIVALLEPFIDTVVICTMTALVIVISGYGEMGQEAALGLAKSGDLQAIELTSSAFAQTMSWFPIVLSIAVILFALSTMISWSYYGLKSWTFLFGESAISDATYKAIFCLVVIIGSAISAQSVFDFGDAMIFAMCFPNVLGLYFLMGEVKQDVADYFKRVRSGEIKRYD